MKKKRSRPFWALLFSLGLAGCSVLVLLDAFVIPKSIASAAPASSLPASSQENGSVPQGEETTPAEADALCYESDTLKINIEELVEYDTTIYLADIQTSDPSLLKTALAQNTYGRNIKEATSVMATQNDAILAINGDYYGFRDSGYVLRNGTLYRETARSPGEDDALVVDANGNFSIVVEDEVSAQSLLEAGAQQVFSFGPALVLDGEVAVTSEDEVSRSKSSNPRTAIAQVGEGHYLMLVSGGRDNESAGLSLVQLAQVLADHGAKTAYNLDGGGSSTLVFNGEVINSPAGGRRGESERVVSDIVYIG